MAGRPLARRVPLPVRKAIVEATPRHVWDRISPLAHGETAWQQAAERGRAAVAVRRHRRAISGDTVPLRTAGRAYLARTVDRFTATDALDGNLALVAAILRQADAPFAVVEAAAGRRRCVLVPASARRRVLEALARPVKQRPGYVGAVDGERLRHVVPLGSRPRRALERAAVMRVFEVLAAPRGTLLAGPDLGCDVEFWEEAPGGALAASRPNRHAVLLPRQEQERVDLQVGRHLYPSHPAFLAPHPWDVDFPIDIVYTWVDGEDPAWRARQQEAWSGVDPGSVNDLSANASRYLSRDELRFSLRSVAMYAGWVRRIHLVTDDQVPPWLDTDHPKIRVVSHRELFGGTGALPTFNSHAIESRLHRVPDLAEHYLYLNDDVFMGRPLSPEIFFRGNGVCHFFPSKAQIPPGPARPDEPPVDSAGKNNRDLLAAAFGRVVTHKMKHTPHPQNRRVLEEMESTFGADFERTARSQFRHSDDVSIASSLAHYFAWFTGRAVPQDIRYYYADIAAPQTPARLRHLLRERDYDSFCLNDHDSAEMDAVTQAAIIHSFLQSYYPLPSEFERRDSPDLTSRTCWAGGGTAPASR